MSVTATQLVTYWTCPFLWHVSYERKEPLPLWGSRRRFGNVIHAAIAEYERRGRSLERAILFLEDAGAGLSVQERDEAQSILVWRHERASKRTARPTLIEGGLRASVDGHRLDVRMDRLDHRGGELLLAEYKGGMQVDLRLVRTQMAILATAVLDVFGQAPATWELELLRARQLVEIPAETSPQALRRFTGGLIQAIREGRREPEPYDPRFCSGCPAKAYCPRQTVRPKPFSRALARRAEDQLTLF